MTERELLLERKVQLLEELAQVNEKLVGAESAPQLVIALPTARAYSTKREAVRKRLQRARRRAAAAGGGTLGTSVPAVPLHIENARAARGSKNNCKNKENYKAPGRRASKADFRRVWVHVGQVAQRLGVEYPQPAPPVERRFARELLLGAESVEAACSAVELYAEKYAADPFLRDQGFTLRYPAQQRRWLLERFVHRSGRRRPPLHRDEGSTPPPLPSQQLLPTPPQLGPPRPPGPPRVAGPPVALRELLARFAS